MGEGSRDGLGPDGVRAAASTTPTTYWTEVPLPWRDLPAISLALQVMVAAILAPLYSVAADRIGLW